MDLRLEVARRNAGFRAWKAYAPMLRIAWKFHSGGFPELTTGCEECGYTCNYAPGDSEYTTAMLDEAEKFEITNACHHVQLLLGPEPPEVAAVRELELLANG